jgi:hypothetical protein
MILKIHICQIITLKNIFNGTFFCLSHIIDLQASIIMAVYTKYLKIGLCSHICLDYSIHMRTIRLRKIRKSLKTKNLSMIKYICIKTSPIIKEKIVKVLVLAISTSLIQILNFCYFTI